MAKPLCCPALLMVASKESDLAVFVTMLESGEVVYIHFKEKISYNRFTACDMNAYAKMTFYILSKSVFCLSSKTV